MFWNQGGHQRSATPEAYRCPCLSGPSCHLPSRDQLITLCQLSFLPISGPVAPRPRPPVHLPSILVSVSPHPLPAPLPSPAPISSSPRFSLLPAPPSPCLPLSVGGPGASQWTLREDMQGMEGWSLTCDIHASSTPDYLTRDEWSSHLLCPEKLPCLFLWLLSSCSAPSSGPDAQRHVGGGMRGWKELANPHPAKDDGHLGIQEGDLSCGPGRVGGIPNPATQGLVPRELGPARSGQGLAPQKVQTCVRPPPAPLAPEQRTWSPCF